MDLGLTGDLSLPLASFLGGFILFLGNLLLVMSFRQHDELKQVRMMITSLRIIIALVMTAQLPIIYLTVKYGSPMETPLLTYGSQGRSWLYYLGRPATTFLGVIFGFFSDLHYSFRYVCFLALMLALIWDTLSQAQVANRLECLLEERCPQREVWSALLLRVFLYRDLAGLALDTWGLLVEGYLLAFIGFYPPYYYSYRQLTVGEENRLWALEEAYHTYFPTADLYGKYFGHRDYEEEVAMRRGSKIHTPVVTTNLPDTDSIIEEGGGGGGAAAKAKKKRSV